jgi:hypothetical protein
MSMLAILLGKARTRRPFKQEIMAALEASSLNPCIRSNFAHPPSSDVCPNLASRMQKHTEPGVNDGHIAWENSCERTPQTIQA